MGFLLERRDQVGNIKAAALPGVEHVLDGFLKSTGADFVAQGVKEEQAFGANYPGIRVRSRRRRFGYDGESAMNDFGLNHGSSSCFARQGGSKSRQSRDGRPLFVKPGI